MISKLRTFIENLKRLRHEPIIAVGLAIEALHVYEQSVNGGLSPEDAAYAAVIGVLTILGRQLVFPASKVQVLRTGVPVVVSHESPAEEPLGRPYTGESQ